MAKLRTLGHKLRPSSAFKLRPPEKVKRSEYYDERWVQLRARIVAERGSRCEVCGKVGRVLADHIIELSDGGALLDPSNIQLLCDVHHGEKTAQARADRAHGRFRL
jgi:5-methylcytosine-specific restriction protein A